jgi:hypothetical protein
VDIEIERSEFRDVTDNSDPAVCREVVRRLELAAALSIAGERAEAMRENATGLFVLAKINVTEAEHAPILEGFVARMMEPAMRVFLAGDPGPALAGGASSSCSLSSLAGTHPADGQVWDLQHATAPESRWAQTTAIPLAARSRTERG